MNYIDINTITDLSKILEEPLYLTADPSLIDDETHHNMWLLNFSDNLIDELEVKDLEVFLSQLLKKRAAQLMHLYPNQSATFYCWFDKQASQLRFTIISGSNALLPFGCKLHLLDSPETILKDFISVSRDYALNDEKITYFDSSEDIADVTNEPEYVLDVYVKGIQML